MRRTLRTKFALTHILPIVLLMPILSLYLLYTLEGFYTQSLLQHLGYQAQLVRSQVESNPGLIGSKPTAQNFLNSIAGLTDARIVLLDEKAIILASTRAEDAPLIGTPLDNPSVAQALRGETVRGVGPGFTTDVAYVILPIHNGAQLTGALRLSYEVTDVRTQFDQMQWLIISGTFITIVLALGLSLILATTITRPLHQLSESAREIAAGNYQARVSGRGQDEIAVLANSFNQMAAKLEEVEQARGRQLAAITHELSRPLTGMRAAIDTLHEDGEVDSETRDMLLDGVTEELARLERLIGTLQGLSRTPFHPLRLQRTLISIERVIRASVANFEPAAAQAGLTLTTEIPRALPLVNADEDRLIQVLTNLLDNALKFTPRGGRVVVRAETNSGQVRITVADSGVGISPDELSHLFQQFYRGDDSRPPEKRGMGLGLSISREIVTAHGGTINVESSPGQGARFTFSLPLQ